MKRQTTSRTLLLTIASLTAFAITAASCHDQLEDNGRSQSGKEIRFSAGIERPGVSKTAYEITGSESAGGTVAIKWQRDDRIRIYCEEAVEPKGQEGRSYADYWVTDDISSDGSIAAIEGLGGLGLRWNTTSGTVHHFYAMAPGPCEGHSAAVSISKNKVSATIPQEQNTLADGLTEADGNWTLAPDMMWQLLCGTETYTYSPDLKYPNDIFMKFNPYSTAVQFTIENGGTENLNLYKLEVISEGNQISGDFTVDLDEDYATNADITGKDKADLGANDKSVTLSLPDNDSEPSKAGVVLATGKKMTFTVFLAPVKDVNDLTFKLYKRQEIKDGVGNGTGTYENVWMSTKLAYNDGPRTGVTFPAKKITFINGLLVPDGAVWQVKYSTAVDAWVSQSLPDHPTAEILPGPFVSPWTVGKEDTKEMKKYNFQLELDGPTVFDHDGTTKLAGGTSDLTVVSFRELNHEQTPVIWYLQYYENGVWKTAKANEVIGNLVSFTPTADLATAGPEIEIIGPSVIKMTVKASESKSSKTHTERLMEAPAKGDELAPYDLSMYDIYGNVRPGMGTKDPKPVTANSYVISSRGHYAIPLVYGNALDYVAAPAGGINTNAYNPGGETDPTNTYLSRFFNSAGKGIRNPYIESDLSDVNATWSAVEVWSSASFIENLTYVSAEDAEEEYNLHSMKGECGYLLFEVGDNIVQGNAVLALKHGSDIVWSWHIWVTDDDLTSVPVTNYSGRTQQTLPVNLGWVDSDNDAEDYYEEAYVRMRLVQELSEAEQEFIVGRKRETTATHESGTSTFYQWGRKDPFVGTPTPVTSISTIATSIKNPATVYKGSTHYWYNETVSSTPAHFYNMWSAINKSLNKAAQGYQTKPLKTIYDPCPPGFQIPQGTAYTGFTTTGENSDNPDEFNVVKPYSNGWYFYTGNGVNTIFFPEGCNYAVSVPAEDTAGVICGCYMWLDETHMHVYTKSYQDAYYNVRPVQE